MMSPYAAWDTWVDWLLQYRLYYWGPLEEIGALSYGELFSFEQDDLWSFFGPSSTLPSIQSTI